MWHGGSWQVRFGPAQPSPAQPHQGSCSSVNVGQSVPHMDKAWEFFRKMGSPKFHVAPMVDQSELPFRMLCRKYGATCAYTPMLHARLFCEDPKYRQEVLTTCAADRPLLVQFCANNPDFLVTAASLAAEHADAVDINFGCPQRIANGRSRRRGNYGSFLMDDLPLVEKLVTRLAQASKVPVSCKIRVFPKLEDTLAYARMVERSGCYLLAVHGRTREQKDNSRTRADWDQIRAVKQALSIPVLANGNIRHLRDALQCLEYTGCDGVLSAESLLEDPALFSPQRLLPGGEYTALEGVRLCEEYLGLVVQHPVPARMVRGHIHKLLGGWLAEYTELRERLNRGSRDIQVREAADQAGACLELVRELRELIAASGRTAPVPAISARALERMAREEARLAAIAEQDREEAGLQALSAAPGSVEGPAPAHTIRPGSLCVDQQTNATSLGPHFTSQPLQMVKASCEDCTTLGRMHGTMLRKQSFVLSQLIMMPFVNTINGDAGLGKELCDVCTQQLGHPVMR
ncbi:hypothetical protein QJQ45_020542 [Haematococcus lacustris]|nr:hypothetical protein QJQ45_020542 [Haematococcus lacustris]